MAEARMWRVHPNPETGMVDEDELAKSLYEAGVLLRRGGGGVVMLANRKRIPDHPQELPTERYTESIDIQWTARTDTQPRYEDVPVAEPVAGADLEDEPVAEPELAVAE